MAVKINVVRLSNSATLEIAMDRRIDGARQVQLRAMHDHDEAIFFHESAEVLERAILDAADEIRAERIRGSESSAWNERREAKQIRVRTQRYRKTGKL